MRISIRGLDTGFVYPCTRREVIDVFGKDLLSSASFKDRYQFYEARQGKKRPFRGKVLANVYISPNYVLSDPSAWVYIYCIRENEFSIHIGHQLVRTMKEVMRPWVEQMLKAAESLPYRGYELVAVLSEDGLQLWELRSLPKTIESKQIPL